MSLCSRGSNRSKLANFVHGTDCACGQSQADSCQSNGQPPRNYNITRTCYPDTKAPRQVSVMVRCCPCPAGDNNDNEAPSRRLLNVDAMEELCYFTKNEDTNSSPYDCYNVCECCGVLTKYMDGQNGQNNENDPCNCTPVKYARRQRFTFRDDKKKPGPPPPWPFPHELTCPEINGCGGGSSRGANGPSPNGASCDDNLPSQSGVYYFSKTDNRMIYQQKENCPPPPPPPQPQSRGDLCQSESNCCQQKSPVVIQPMCNGPFGGGGGGCNPYMNPYMMNPYCNPCMPCCNNPCMPYCNPCCGPCNPCCGPCGNNCNPCGNNNCCNPCGNNCCNPCANNNCCNSCPCPPQNPCNCCCCYPPQPPPPPLPAGQTTVIPMCIPINPPPPPPVCMPCCRPKKKKKKKCEETIIELRNSPCYNPCCNPCCDPCGASCSGGQMASGSCGSGSCPPSGCSYQVDGCSNGMQNVSVDNYCTRPQSCCQQNNCCCSPPQPPPCCRPQTTCFQQSCPQ